MTNFVVTSLSDVSANDGQLTLREALQNAKSDRVANADGPAGSGADTITFAANLSGGTVKLTQASLFFDTDITVLGDIDGDGVGDISISAPANLRALNIVGGTTTLDGLTIRDGDVTNSALGGGGGIRVESSATLTMTNGSFVGNSSIWGGGLWNSGAINLNTVSFSRNGVQYDGGAIFNDTNATAVLRNVSLTANTAPRDGGGIYNRGAMDIINTTISQNRAVDDGGGFFNGTGGAARLTNTTLVGNFAGDDGGGIYDTGRVTLIHGTVTGNKATRDGGGVASEPGSQTTLVNSIVVGNSAGSGFNVAGSVGNTDSVTAGISSQIFTKVDPANGGGGLADNGGLVQTVALKSAFSNPAIDRGFQVGNLALDATGGARNIDIPRFQNKKGATVDAGAVEIAPETASQVVTTALDTINPFDGLTSLREAIASASAGQTVTFDPGLVGSRIVLTQGELRVHRDLTIDGGTHAIAIDANGASRVMATAGSGTDLTLQALTLTGGGNVQIGAGLLVAPNTTATVVDTTFEGNSTSGSGTKSGGAIFVYTGATLDLNQSTIAGNQSTNGGGLANRGTATLNNVTISGNDASATLGGGIYNVGTLVAYHSTVSGNSAIAGGGIAAGGGSTSVINSIVLGNRVIGSNQTDVELSGPVGLADSVTSGDPTLVFAQGSLSTGGLLADNGGPVQTIALRAASNNPALDIASSSLTVDATGNGRSADLQGVNNGGAADAGAFELQGGQLEARSLIVTTDQDTVNPWDNQTSLREAVAFANSNADQSAITFSSAVDGATIDVSRGVLRLTNDVTIDGGNAGVTLDAKGAGQIFVSDKAGSDIGLSNLTLTGGSAGYGGAVRLYSGVTLSISDATISGNTSTGAGGAIFAAAGSSLDISNTTFDGNSSGKWGGAVFASGYIAADATTFSANRAVYDGGALFVDTGVAAQLTNVTMSGNTAGLTGGGMYSRGIANLTHVTVSGNQADNAGGIAALGGGSTTLTNSIVLGNTANTQFNESVGGASNNNSILGGTPSSVFAAMDARTGGGLLANNGGPVETIALQPAPGNAAVDGGAAFGGLASDATGHSRSVDQPGINNGGTADLGAYELQAFTTGTAGNDKVQILGSTNDYYIGLGGDDRIKDFGGTNTLDGGAGNDFIEGGNGTDLLIGGDGDDTLNGFASADFIRGDNGNDRIEWLWGGGADTIDGGAGTDIVVLDLDNRGIGSTGITFSANAQNDLIVSLNGFQSQITIRNVENLRILADPNGSTVLGSGALQAAGIAQNTIFFEGGEGNDSFDASAIKDVRVVLDGGPGDDTLLGGDGDDVIDGGTGNNVQSGGAGLDQILLDLANGGATGALTGLAAGDLLSLQGQAKGDVLVRTDDAGQTFLLIDYDGDGNKETRLELMGDFGPNPEQALTIDTTGDGIQIAVNPPVPTLVIDGASYAGLFLRPDGSLLIEADSGERAVLDGPYSQVDLDAAVTSFSNGKLSIFIETDSGAASDVSIEDIFIFTDTPQTPVEDDSVPIDGGNMAPLDGTVSDLEERVEDPFALLAPEEPFDFI